MKHLYSKSNLHLLLFAALSLNLSAQNWHHVPVFPSSVASGFDIVSAIAMDDQNLYAISHLSEVAVSNDGGKNWTENTPANLGFGEFQALESNGSELYLYDMGYGFTPTPRIFKSTDNGTSWSLDSSGYNRTILKPEFQFANNHWWLSYDRNKGYLPKAPYRYDNTTSSWQEKINAPEAQDICEVHDSLFAINNQNQLIKSSDNGEHWRTISSPFPNALMSCLVAHNDTLFTLSREVLSQDCFFSFSADEGATWTNTNLSGFQKAGPISKLIFYLMAIDGNNIILTSLDNNNQDSLVHVLTSNDRGASFQADSFAAHGPFLVLHEVYLKGETAYLLIDDRIYSNGSGSGLNLFSKISTEVSLYPNPCTNQLHIATNNRNEPILVLDTQGRILHKMEPSPSFIWDTSQLKPGIYFLKQGASGKTFVKK